MPSGDARASADFHDTYEAFVEGGLAGAMEKALLTCENALPAGGEGPWLARYTDNHAEGHGLYRFGEGGSRAAVQLAFLAPHTLPFLIAGPEFGALNRPPIHERIAPCDKGRRLRRADGSVETQAGIEFEANLFARGTEQRQGWYAFYRELIRLRRRTRELREGSFSLIGVGEESPGSARNVIAFERLLRSRSVRCAVNLGPDVRRLGLIFPEA